MEFYYLRWRFEYADGKPAKYGMWSQPSVSVRDTAAFCSKENLALAMIEGRHAVTREDKIMAVVPGADYCNHQWMAESNFSPFGHGGRLQQNIIGMKIQARDEEITVFASGEVRREARASGHLNLAAY
jgi:hypothetical protein